MTTNSERDARIAELGRVAAQLDTQVSLSREMVLSLGREVNRLQNQLDPIHRDWSKTQDRLDKLEKASDQWSVRIWDAAKLLLAAAVGGVVTYLVKR